MNKEGRLPVAGAYETISAENRAKVDQLLADTAKNGGLAPLDPDAFWRDQAAAKADPFGKDIPQVPLGAICNRECIFDELGIEQDWWRFLYEDKPWALDISRQYNDKAQAIVGKRLVPEAPLPDPGMQWPGIKALHDIFEAENVWEGGAAGSWWLKQSVDTPEELAALLDRVEACLGHLRDFMLPENWDAEKERLTAMGKKVPTYRQQRGPCTFACSIYGAENLILLSFDDPSLFARFSDVLGRAILARAKVLDDEAGMTPGEAQGRWSWADDNCCLFNTDMYEKFAMPIHRAVFGRYAPEARQRRYQHSDSNMAHLLPLLAELDLTGTNFGPTLTVAEIRKHCPHAVIDGQMAPFTYSRNEEANMVAEFLRDFDQAREHRGLNFTTAGSINNGSRLSGMRLLMAAIQHYGRYD
jgi:uroporphyrinogen decarboxylase